jgi:serine/threonine protein kinase
MVDGPSSSQTGADYLQAPSLVGEVLDGRYKITRKLGEGGMGEVFAAEHVHIEKKFAIKLLRPEIVSNAEAVQRFRQEARSASSIGHRNIIAIEDFGALPDGRIYMCMELLNGAALNDLITQPQPVDRLLNILIQTGHGLAAAHAKGIIHRDMKPENIFVTVGPQGEDVPKLLDFGIAKVSGNDGQNHLTRTGTIFGTPFYMAPEQALGNPVDARTDIYAVGVIMYEVFCGSLPFQGESFMGILTQHITTEPEPPAQRAAKNGRQLPPGLAEIISRCMRKNPAERFGTMDELVNSLVTIYRGVAGPGMSTYMEAFPVSARHPITTPPPMTGGHATAPTQTPMPQHPGSRTGPGVQAYPPQPGTGPMQQPYPHGAAPGTGPYPHHTPGSGVYPYGPGGSMPMPKKSNAGIIIAIIALLVVGGGVTAAVLLLNNKEEPKKVAVADAAAPPVTVDAPQVAIIDAGTPATIDAGGGVLPPPQIDAGAPEVPDGNKKLDAIADKGCACSDKACGKSVLGEFGTLVKENPPGDQEKAKASIIRLLMCLKKVGVSDADIKVAIKGGTGGVEPPRTVNVVIRAKNVTSFDVYEGSKKVLDGGGSIEVAQGAKRTLTVKSPGYKSKTIVIDGTKPTVEFRLEKESKPPPDGGETPPPMDCRKVLIDGMNKQCLKQYCDLHAADPRCGLE